MRNVFFPIFRINSNYFRNFSYLQNKVVKYCTRVASSSRLLIKECGVLWVYQAYEEETFYKLRKKSKPTLLYLTYQSFDLLNRLCMNSGFNKFIIISPQTSALRNVCICGYYRFAKPHKLTIYKRIRKLTTVFDCVERWNTLSILLLK